MSLRVSFELDENDLQHFRLIMRAARSAAGHMPPEDIVAGAEDLLRGIEELSTPGFILERINKLRLLIRMMTDLDWRLPHREATRVLSALTYFTEPDDLIPDQIPGLGFLDDAIMVELVVRELHHEIEAYEDFCNVRDEVSSELKAQTKASRNDWLDGHRKELQLRMRERSDGADAELRLFD